MTPTLELRPYQIAAIEQLNAMRAAGRRCILMVAPTGAGKTLIAAEVIRRAVDRGRRALIMAHRRELISQISRKLHEAGVDHGIVAAGFPTRPSERVQVGSVQTVHARAIRSRSIEAPDADLVVVDEAHHVRARSYQAILDLYPDAALLGMTATPCRGDGRGLGNVFESLAECPPVAELTAAGFLVPATVYAPSRPDLTGVRVRHGDYAEPELAARVDTAKLVGDIGEHWHRLAGRRRTVVFATGVKHSVHVRDEFRRLGVMAEHIDGSTPTGDRDRILVQLAAGQIEVVSNAMVLTEGWDQPETSCLILARPTKSLGLYRQMVGRVLRPAPGKTDALILDHSGAVFMHGFPDDPIEWALSEDRRAVNTAHAARVGWGAAPRLTTCPECQAVRFEGRPCQVCGWRPTPKAAPVVFADGDLGRVERDRVVSPFEWSADQRRRFHGELRYIAQVRGYQEGWASHKYREKFGIWPPWGVAPDPLPPAPETRSWVRSRAIAFAKSQR
jgi:superfamily II DNA or RNA helicase